MTAPNPADRPKGGPLARQAAIACDSIPFRTFLYQVHKQRAFTEIACREAILRICSSGPPLESRALLDHDTAAGDRWKRLWREYNAWMRT